MFHDLGDPARRGAWKKLRFFPKRLLTLRNFLAISPSLLMGTESIGSRSFHSATGSSKAKTFQLVACPENRTKIFEILTLKVKSEGNRKN